MERGVAGKMADAIVYPVGNVTFVFTDIEGSSRMTSELEQTQVGRFEKELRGPHRERLLPLAARHHGLEIGRAGDGHLFVFQMVDEALACVTAFQRALHEDPILHTEGEKTYAIKVRIGVHTAMVQREPTLMEDGLPEYSGNDTNFAARIGSLGVGEQILVSKATYDHARQLRDYEQPPCAVKPWPGRFLKSFPGPHTVYEILYFVGQTAFEPGMRWFSEWYRSERNRFVDRPDKEQKISDCFEKGRMVTITGIGGTGKTRLAIACAAQRANLYDDGVYFVSLATADLVENPSAVTASRNLAFVAQTIGAALNRTGAVAQPAPLFEWLRTKNLLLVLNNYESVRCDEVGHYLLQLVTETAGVSLLVTGRETVGADDVGKLVNLNDGMTEKEGHTLFLDRAQQKDQLTGELTPEQETQLSRILALTERIPLALELAAAQIADYSLHEIADGIAATPLGDMSKAVGLRADDLIAFRRHRSLERSLTWSYNLLDAVAQRVLATTSLFADNFDAATLKTVHGDKEARHGLRSLRNASLILLRGDPGSADAYRFRLHRATREFATQRLTALATASDTQRRFVAHYVALVEENGDKLNDLSRHPLLDNEWHNILAAADLAEMMQDHRSVMILSQVGGFLSLRGLWFEQEGIYLQAIGAAHAEGYRPNEGVALSQLGIVYGSQGRWDEAINVLQQSLGIAREFKDRIGEVQTLNTLGNVYRGQGRWNEAINVFLQNLSIYREFKDRAGEGLTLNNLGIVYQYQGRWDEAIDVLQQSLRIDREFKDRIGESLTLNNLGIVYQYQGRWDDATNVYLQSLSIKREFQDRIGEGQTLMGIGSVYQYQGRWDEAINVYLQSLSICREFKDRITEGLILHNLGNVYLYQGRWDDAYHVFQQGLNICRDFKDRIGEGQTLYNLALLYKAQGNRKVALAFTRQSVDVLASTEAKEDLKNAQDLVARLESGA